MIRAALLALALTGCAQTIPLASAPADSGMSAAQAAIEAAKRQRVVAQYWEDWSGSTIGNEPTGWTKRWVTSDVTYVVEADAAGPAGRRLRISKSSTGRRAITMDAIDADAGRATIKIRALVVAPSTANNAATLFGVLGRGSGAATAETGYISAFFQKTGTAGTRTIVTSEYATGTNTLTDSAPYAYVIGDEYWIGFEADGSTIRRTLATRADPDTLLIDDSVTDSTTSAAGWGGLFSFVSSQSPYYILAIGIGTGGDEAPTSDPAGGTHALAGAATVSASASADLTTAGPNPVKGVRVQLGTGAESLTGLLMRYWDDPQASGAPDYEATDGATDADRWVEIDLDAVTAHDLGGIGNLRVIKQGATPQDDIEAGGRVPIVDIAQ